MDDQDRVIHPYKDDNCVIFHNKLKYNKLPQTCDSPTSESSDDDNLDITTSTIINPLTNDHKNTTTNDSLPDDLLMSDNNLIVFHDDIDTDNNINNDGNIEDNVSDTSLDVFQDSLEI